MKAWLDKYRALTGREQLLILLSATTVIIAIFYFVIWSPLNQSIQQQRTKLTSQTELLAWVQESAIRAQQLRLTQGNTATFTGSLAQIVSSTSPQHKISVSRMQPQDNELQVWIDEVEFNALLSWLNTLEQRGVTVIQVDLVEADKPGNVKVRRLQLGAA